MIGGIVGRIVIAVDLIAPPDGIGSIYEAARGALFQLEEDREDLGL